MTDLRVCSFQSGRRTLPGLVAGGRVVGLEAGYRALGDAPRPPRSLMVLMGQVAAHRGALTRLAQALEAGNAGLLAASQKLAEVKLRAPLLYPGTIFAAGGNYRDHLAEMRGGGVERGKDLPYFFVKPPLKTVIGPGDAVPYPAHCEALDWEVELAVIIGKTCRDLPAEWSAVRPYIAGYTILLDMSVRKFPRHAVFGTDWVVGKAFDGAAPMGPCILLDAPDIDPMTLGLRLSVNEVVKQDSNAAMMIYSITEQVSWVSRNTTLAPGDVISTGTPSGVGAGRGEFLNPGDVVRAQIDRIGELSVPIMARA